MKIKFDLLLNWIEKLFSMVIKAQGTQTRRKVGLTRRLHSFLSAWTDPLAEVSESGPGSQGPRVSRGQVKPGTTMPREDHIAGKLRKLFS